MIIVPIPECPTHKTAVEYQLFNVTGSNGDDYLVHPMYCRPGDHYLTKDLASSGLEDALDSELNYPFDEHVKPKSWKEVR